MTCCLRSHRCPGERSLPLLLADVDHNLQALPSTPSTLEPPDTGGRACFALWHHRPEGDSILPFRASDPPPSPRRGGIGLFRSLQPPCCRRSRLPIPPFRGNGRGSADTREQTPTPSPRRFQTTSGQRRRSRFHERGLRACHLGRTASSPGCSGALRRRKEHRRPLLNPDGRAADPDSSISAG